MVGGGDMSTPEGFFQLETFGIMAPAAVMMVTVAAGARALAGEESDRTMGLLLANPVPRSRVVLHKAAAMGLHGVVVGVATFAGVVGGSVVAGLGMSVGNIAATCVMVTLLGIMFGALALAIGAGTGRVRAATIGTVGIAGAAYMANAILPVVDSLSGWARLSPFHWYLGEAPLVNGMPWGLAALFGVAIAMLTAAAVLLFDQRDLHRD